jgi:hypothetical protein
VRILDEHRATAATTRVLIDSTDGKRVWGAVGVGENIIEASWQALVDGLEYGVNGSEKGRARVSPKPGYRDSINRRGWVAVRLCETPRSTASGALLPIPALRQLMEKSWPICSAKMPSPLMREPKRGSLSFPPRIERMRFSTFSLRSGK